MRASAAELFFSSRGHAVGQGFLKHAIPWFLGLVFDTGLSVTPLKGHLGCLASHSSVLVLKLTHWDLCNVNEGVGYSLF